MTANVQRSTNFLTNKQTGRNISTVQRVHVFSSTLGIIGLKILTDGWGLGLQHCWVALLWGRELSQKARFSLYLQPHDHRWGLDPGLEPGLTGKVWFGYRAQAVERSSARGVVEMFRMSDQDPHTRLPGEEFQVCPPRKKLQGRPRTHGERLHLWSGKALGDLGPCTSLYSIHSHVCRPHKHLQTTSHL